MSSEHAPVIPSPHSKPFQYYPVIDDGGANGNAGGGESALLWNYQNGDGLSIEQRERNAQQRGVQEGESRARVSFEQELISNRASIAGAIEQFKKQRADYFSHIEPEVVQLALAIARKILHREAQMDPLLLTGIVHVALEKLDVGTRVRLRTHPGDIHFWNQHFTSAGSFQPAPELIGDPTLRPGELALETDLGSTQISLETQLKEIEQGFFDLLEQRPRVR